MKTITLSILIILLTCGLSAQYLVKPTNMEITGVSNAGIVSGYEEWGGPYLLWNPADNSIDNIGGAAPGNGIGGMARFSADGNYLSGSVYTTVPVNMDWQRNTLADYNFIFRDIEFPASGNGFVGYAGGQSVTYNGDGILLKTNDAGTTWEPMWADSTSHGIEAISFPNDITGYICGWNQFCAKTNDGGWSWTELTPGGTADVYIYTAACFKDENNGMIAAQLQNGTAIYITTDGGQTWTPGTGLASVPYAITYFGGDTYFLVTNAGHIQKSINNGLTWTTMQTIAGGLLLGINFSDSQFGIVTGEGYIYKSQNGGNSWTPQAVGPDVLWRDVEWVDDQHIILCGTPDMIYESSDGGATWDWANQNTSTMGPALYGISVRGNKAHVCGSQGTFYKRSTVSTQTVSMMARYSTATREWTELGSLGYSMDGNMSSGWSISGDGQTVVGNAWANPPAGSGIVQGTHAVAWNATEGLIDLGSLYDELNRSTRADAVSHNGDVIVGWQDANGPWKSAVWRRNPAGAYFPNEFILVDPEGNSEDENNQAAAAQAISGNGVMVGGMSDWATNYQVWLWTEASNLTYLASMPDAMPYVTGINYDGNIVIGYFNMGMWDPRVPFIWTPSGGLQNLNDYVSQTLGIEMGSNVIYTPMDISPNGRYIAGAGFNPDAGEWGEYTAFRLQMPVTDIEDEVLPSVSAVLQSASPNPFRISTRLSFTLPKGDKVSLKIYNTKGQLVRSLVNETRSEGTHALDWDARDNNGSLVATGVYFCRLQTTGSIVVKKLVVLK